MEFSCCLSPQEERLRKNISDTEGRERLYKILRSVQHEVPVIDIERALYFTESMKQTEGQLLTLRWAKALKNCAEKMSVYITPGQLIAGRAGRLGRYGVLYPEIDGDFYPVVIQNLTQRERCPFQISEEDAKVILSDTAPFWAGKTFHEHLNNALPADLRGVTYLDPLGLNSKFVVSETASYRSALQWVHDYEKVLKRGFLGLQGEARRKLATLDPDSPVANWDRRPFWRPWSSSATP